MGQRVLVIDDSITVCKVVEICLRRAGYEVTCLSDGVKAIQWLQSGGETPDLILVDLCLPGMDGYGVMQCLRAQPNFDSVGEQHFGQNRVPNFHWF